MESATRPAASGKRPNQRVIEGTDHHFPSHFELKKTPVQHQPMDFDGFGFLTPHELGSSTSGDRQGIAHPRVVPPPRDAQTLSPTSELMVVDASTAALCISHC
jgi:hypothetical protein